MTLVEELDRVGIQLLDDFILSVSEVALAG